MLLRGNIRTIKCHIESSTQEPLSDDSPVVPWLVEYAGCILSRCQKGRDGKTPFERMHGKRPTQEFVPFGEVVLARQITTEPRNKMNTRYQYGVWLGMRSNSAECFIGNADGVFGAREIRRLEPQDRSGTEAINSVIGVPWRMTDGKVTEDRPEVRVDPIPIPPYHWMPKLQCDQRQKEGTSPFRSLQKESRRMPQSHSTRRNEVINEALAEEVRRGEQRKKRSDKATAAVPESEPAASAASEQRESPVEPDPNPKRRLLMMSASSTASGSGQHKEMRSISDDESRMQVQNMSEVGIGGSTTWPGAPLASIRRRIAVKSEPLAVTAQEAVDGYSEKAMTIASVEPIELGNIMELSITDQVLK